MSSKSYTNLFTFGEQKITIEDDDQEADYGLRMARAIDVQLIDTNLYMSKELYLPLGARGVFGGQIVAQALKAAWDTVPEDFFIHSLHAYFILACSVETPVIYSIQRVQDRRSFARPEQGAVLDHQTSMPNVPNPESLPSDIETLEDALKKISNPSMRFLKRLETRLKDAGIVEYRNVRKDSPEEVVSGNVQPNGSDQHWFKTRGKLNDDMKLHACCIAYVSDAALLNTAAIANGMTFSSSSVGMMTSLDHTIWFHMPARADEWLLYHKYSPRTNSGRGFAFGHIYSQDGSLVATTAQEGVIRLSKKEQERRQKQYQETTNDQSKL
ncbi:hypothetical protein G6F57_001608 [Rhizopus arrhizus]|uniref:Uncharacterized protein n=1 Tax=Rhizopus oryzae TaxID=64495 RepID=A0A9P7BYE7_RHIOR|nr:hypothetical protein G6F23_000934 [Rhizopus arrhizus]KAG1423997.1 hypothetical protein G6F58_002585 [Rhizopus delemar]KAG0769922.1 hypothetical protein G6F24_000670 [Rhizopus arrhizus]KAG0797455.1 hypothetical protein G6F21_000521 [Rhizopus arrhizus]KAG0799309.1 hypothetical protein G6F22_003356 [Rhizopus arrhizus]